MICPTCKTECYDNDICPNCGQVLKERILVCPNCGKVIEKGEEVCPRCGSEIVKKKVFSGIKNEYVAYTPKYVAKMPFSIPTVFLIMVFMVYSLVYNIVTYANKLGGEYSSYGFKQSLLALVTTDTRPIILLSLSILSVITFITRLAVNHGKMDTKSLEKKLGRVKCLILADCFSFYTYFFISFWPTVFNMKTTPYYIAATLGMCVVIISLITLPIFYRKSKIRTR